MTMTEDKCIFADDTELEDFPWREGLTWKEKKEAEYLYTIARGVMMVSGDARSGKDLFASSLASLNKYYFGDILNPSEPRKILLDFIPKKAMGKYYLFDAEFMMNEINKMAKAAKMEGVTESSDKQEASEFISKSATKWATEGEGEILLKGAYLYLSELKRYCYNRNPHNPFNKFIGSICSVWGHLDLLIVGTHIQPHEIDQYSFLYYVTHWAKCEWMTTMPNTSRVTITRGKFMQGNNVWNLTSKPTYMYVDGAKPRQFLNGARFYDLYPTKNYVNLKPVVRKEKGNG